jgi:hypothetical protein
VVPHCRVVLQTALPVPVGPFQQDKAGNLVRALSRKLMMGSPEEQAMSAAAGWSPGEAQAEGCSALYMVRGVAVLCSPGSDMLCVL